jgi:hypothetical protein
MKIELVETLQRRGKSVGKNEQEKEIRKYIIVHLRLVNQILKPSTPPVRPPTPRSAYSPGPTKRPSSAPTEVSIESEIEQVKPNLNFVNIDKVVPHIRELLAIEKETILDDISYSKLISVELLK